MLKMKQFFCYDSTKMKTMLSNYLLAIPPFQQWDSVFFAFSLIIEGTTEKVLQFIMPLKSIYSRNFGFIAQKNVFLNTTESFKQEKLY